MRRVSLVVTAVLLAGCGSRAAAPDSAPAPSPRAAAPAADPTTLRYGAGSGRYRFEQTQHAVQEVMGQTQEVNATINSVVTAAFTAGTGGNIDAVFTVDSIAATSSVGNAAVMEGMRGKTFRATFAPDGKPVSFTPPDTTMVAMQGMDLFRDFLPLLPRAITAGASWIDTATANPSTGGLRIQTQSVRTNRVVGWEARDGARALHINTTGAITMRGEGEQGGSPLILTGTGTATSDRYISTTGQYLGSTTSDSTNLNVTVVSAGLEVPVRQVRRTTVTRLP